MKTNVKALEVSIQMNRTLKGSELLKGTNLIVVPGPEYSIFLKEKVQLHVAN